MTDADRKRLEEIRQTYYGGVYGNSPGARDVPWLLEKLDEKERELIAARAEIKSLRGMPRELTETKGSFVRIKSFVKCRTRAFMNGKCLDCGEIHD